MARASALARFIVPLALIVEALTAHAQVLRVATVNNAHMLTLQRVSSAFEREHPGVRIEWTVLEEGRLRQQASVDVATRGGRFDVVTIGLLEAPVWGRRGWLMPLEPGPDYGVEDLLPTIRDAVSEGGRLFGAPYYGESSVTMYRRDLLERIGVALPERPTWDDIRRVAARVHDPAKGVSGVCLRGRPGWGENMTLVSTMVNSWGGQWFDSSWSPRLNSPAWAAAASFYVDLVQRYGPPGAVANGYNENLALFEAGRCAIWVDATVALSTLSARDPATEARIGVAWAPVAESPKGSHWLWVWALAVPTSSKQPALARRFALWATGPGFHALAAQREGWASVPPGTRRSTYADRGYQAAHPGWALELQAIQAANPRDATVPPSPYVGIQLAAIPEFQSIGNAVGQHVAAALSGRLSVAEALAQAQEAATRRMAEGAASRR